MNHRSYALPTRGLPGKYTILADIVRNTPYDGDASVTDLCVGLGKNARSLRALISTAVTRAYIQPTMPPHTQGQRYRLTSIGKLVKYALG